MKEHTRDSHVRCLNCFVRFSPKPGAQEARCPECNIEWRISWPYPGTAKIRGPVWNKMKKQEEDKQTV
jgi:hypothetical protein